jgi:hypothetical protein
MSFEQWKKNRIHQEGRPQPPGQIRFPQSIAPMHARNDALPPEADVWSWPEREKTVGFRTPFPKALVGCQ